MSPSGDPEGLRKAGRRQKKALAQPLGTAFLPAFSSYKLLRMHQMLPHTQSTSTLPFCMEGYTAKLGFVSTGGFWWDSGFYTFEYI